MSSNVEIDVCCRLQVAPSGESYEGNRRPGRKQWQTTARYMAWFTSRHLRADCTCTPGSAPGPTLGNEYGKTLPFYLVPMCASHLSAKRWIARRETQHKPTRLYYYCYERKLWVVVEQKKKFSELASHCGHWRLRAERKIASNIVYTVQLFTDTSEHIRFYFLVFLCFSTF